ncbi:MAG: NfeD family protein [Clostridia bacterium]|nr:NfeD family protein [Clostridia bacterium]
MNLGVIWIIAIIVFAVLEAVTYQLISTWFAIGSVGGLVAYLLGFDFNVQMTVFLALSIITLCCLRPLSVKKLKPKGLKTNTENIIGKEVLITETVDNTKECGKGKIGGMEWTVRSDDNSVIPEKQLAVIEKIEGVKLIVKPKGE